MSTSRQATSKELELLPAVTHLRRQLQRGRPWPEALLEAVALWETPEETVGERHYRYLVGGEAFDWLLLAERLLEAVDGLVPAAEREALLFESRLPQPVSPEEVRRRMGSAKYRAHLNYLYGVTAEEGLQLAVAEEIHKERFSGSWRQSESVQDAVFERIYGYPHDRMLRAFREERPELAGPEGELSFRELKEFTYWLFRFRVRRCDPARVASDTRKGLAMLSRLERSHRRRCAPPPEETGAALLDAEAVLRR